MANKYFIKNIPSNWDDTGSWSLSSGGPSGATVPSSVDVVIFDSSGQGLCTIDTTVLILGLNINSNFTGTILNNFNDINVGSSGVTISGMLNLSSNIISIGDILIDGTLIPIPDQNLMKYFYSPILLDYIPSNGVGRALISYGDINIIGLIDGDGGGFDSNKGPGSNSYNNDFSGYGATHCGLGYISTIGAPTPKLSYGNWETPISLGSGSGYYHDPMWYLGENIKGGGAIKLEALSGTILIDGTITMNGDNGTHAGGGSGGSIWIKGWEINGSGLLSAMGGDTRLLTDCGGGGGGYISLWYINQNNFLGDMFVDGQNGGGKGKIFEKYLEPILNDNFSGNILNTKWWNYPINNVSINNGLEFFSPQDDYNFPSINSLFSISGKSIDVSIDFIPNGIPEFSIPIIGGEVFSTNIVAQMDSTVSVAFADLLSFPGLAVKQGLYVFDPGLNIHDLTTVTQGQAYQIALSDNYTWVTPNFYLQGFPDSFVDPVIKSYFLLYSDINNWAGLSITPTGIFGVSSSDGILSSSGIPFDYTNVTLRIIKNDSTFSFEFYNSINNPQLIYSDILPNLANVPLSIALKLDKPESKDIVEIFKVTPLDNINKYISSNYYPIDGTNVSMNLINGPSLFYGSNKDFFTVGNNFSWDVTGGSNISTGDILRIQYERNVPANNDGTIYFTNFKVYEGVLNNTESNNSLLYVDSNFGSDNSTGNQLDPLKNLFVATAWSKNGGTIVLYDGTYNPTNINRKNLSIIGADGCQPTITCLNSLDTTGSNWENNALTFYNCSAKINNIKINGSTNGVYLENGDLDISEINIINSDTGIKLVKCDPTITRTKVYGAITAFDLSSCPDSSLFSNEVYETPIAIHASDSSNLVVSSNTFDSVGTGIALDSSSSCIIVSNNITNSSIGISATLDLYIEVLNNNFFNTTAQYTRIPDVLNNNISVDPNYLNRTIGDFHLIYPSPNEGSGLLSYDTYLIDFDGGSRLDGTVLHSDIGALNFNDITHEGNYVSSGGDNFWNSGLISAPYRTLDKALSVADGTILIDNGHYDTFYLSLSDYFDGTNSVNVYIYLSSVKTFCMYRTLSLGDIANGYINLPGFVIPPEDSSKMAVNVVGGPTQIINLDYKIEFGSLVWRNLGLEPLLAAGDIIRILFEGVLEKRAIDTLILRGNNKTNFDQSHNSIFVSPNGSDSSVSGISGEDSGGNGTKELPYRTISQALSVSNPNDNLIVLAGEYPLFTGKNDRIIVPLYDNSKAINKQPRRFIQDLFNFVEFSNLGSEDFGNLLWDFNYFGNSISYLKNGFLNLIYDGTHSTEISSTFSLNGNLEVTAELRNAIDPLKFIVSCDDNTALFSLDNTSYHVSIYTGGNIYSGNGNLYDYTYSPQNIVEYITLNSSDVDNQYVSLNSIPEPADGTNISVFVVGGPFLVYDIDFYTEDNKIKWDGLNLSVDPGETLVVSYIDRNLSNPTVVSISIHENRAEIKVLINNDWQTLIRIDIENNNPSPWNIQFIMNNIPVESHEYIFGRGFVSKFIAICDSFNNTNIDKTLTDNVEKHNLVLYKERF